MIKSARFDRTIHGGAIFAAALCTTPAYADTYLFLGKSDDNAATFLDLTTMTKSDNQANVWLVTLTGDFLRDRPARIAYYVIRQSFRCKEQLSRPTGMSVYAASGTRLTTDDKGDQEGPVEPGTLEQDAWKIVCGGVSFTQQAFEAGSPLALAQKFKVAVKKSAPNRRRR